MTFDAWIAIILLMLSTAFLVIMPILTLINSHRIRNGKEPLYKGRVREIIIVKKRVAEHEYFDEGYRYNFTRSEAVNSGYVRTARITSVDYRVVGGKILYTKSIDEELLDCLDVGKTYKALIRFDSIKKIYRQ